METYDDEEETFSDKYMKKAVNVGTSSFFAFEEKDDSVISGLYFRDVKDGQKRYYNASKEVIVLNADEATKVRKKLESERKKPGEVDLSDINNIIETDPTGGSRRIFYSLNLKRLIMKKMTRTRSRGGGTSPLAGSSGSGVKPTTMVGILVFGRSS